ncbi:MAG: pyroglutamyl-peptidase I [Candidatus Rokubacteria bacterium]|nr:pyroglutamyl-peptidase I [Candidatus Rokubacteria bacterium]
MILLTGFEPFGTHKVNPSEEIARALDGRRFGEHVVRGVVLPVHHREAAAQMAALLQAIDPAAILHVGLAEGRARIALERVALNVMDYAIADNAGYRALDEACVAGGPPAYFATLPLRDVLAALTADGVPAYISSTAGTYLCNQTLYATLHLVSCAGRTTRVGFVHLPLSAGMVAAAGVELPSMDAPLMQRAIETVLRVVAAT